MKLLPIALLFSALAYGQLPPSGLKCESLTDPMGVDTHRPRFTWVARHEGRNQKQSAYQIEVPGVWDSGKVASSQTAHVAYAGKPLSSGASYTWRVRWWDKDGNLSPWSETARFDTGLFERAEWKGQWIGGANQLRREFALKARPQRARVYVSGVGYYELRINGSKVGNHVLDPGWTTFDKRVLYSTYDVTAALRPGANAVAVSLGEGWYKNRALLLQMNIELEGGGRMELVSDTSWKAHAGPIVADSIYNGETYDARLETPGWDRAGFDDAGWQAAGAVPGPKGVLSAQMMPPIRVVDTIVPLKMSSPRPGMYVYDLGQNISGWMSLRVEGPRGTRVRLRHAEVLYDDGTLNVENLRSAKATDFYTLRGGAPEQWEPRFTYHGFRYVELTGFPGTPRLDTLRARVVHTDVAPAGGFSASKDILNQIQRITLWGIADNLHSVPTDCNQRDERMGWMADAHLYAETAMLNYDAAAFYTNFLRGIRDEQDADGSLTDTVPRRGGRRPADPAWGAAYPLIASYLYLYTGDRAILDTHYAGIKAWTDFQHGRAQDGILDYGYYGDWVAVMKTPQALIWTAYYYWSADTVARWAAILGKTDDAAAYRKLADEIREAFNRKFFTPRTGVYGNGSQTSLVLPLYLDLVPKDLRRRTLSWLRDDIEYANNTHLNTGILGTKYLFPVLTAGGASDLAYELATQTTYPSWGYMIANGATTLWELWQNKTGPSMNSHNHPMFGSIGTWFYTALAGINPDPERPGFERIRIAPQVVRDLRWASGSLETVRGTVASAWRRDENGFRLEVTIPVGSEAEITIPKLGFAALTESGKPVAAKETPAGWVTEAGSGTWVYEVK